MIVSALRSIELSGNERGLNPFQYFMREAVDMCAHIGDYELKREIESKLGRLDAHT